MAAVECVAFAAVVAVGWNGEMVVVWCGLLV